MVCVDWFVIYLFISIMDISGLIKIYYLNIYSNNVTSSLIGWVHTQNDPCAY